MYFFRLIKPEWGKREVQKEVDGKKVLVANPNFVREIEGPDTIGDKTLSAGEIQKRNEAGYNVYFFPNHPAKPVQHFINGRDVDVFNYIFVDMDLKDKVYASKEEFLAKLSEFPAKPSMTVDSGNGIHAYWRISELNRELYVLSQLMLIQHFKTDDSIWTPMQLMRFPGSVNTKDPDNFKPVTLVDGFCSDETYSLDDILQHLPQITPDNERRMVRHLNKLDGKETVEFDANFDTEALPERFKKDLLKNQKLRNLFEDPVGTSGDRSSADMSLANLLFSLDYERDEALQVLMNTKKARSRSDRASYAFGTVEKVYTDRPKYTVASAMERRAKGDGIKNLGRPMNGPAYWDCLHKRWRTKQVLGLIAGSGVGKTTATLNMFRSFIENNPESKDIFVFFSLEMTEGEIYEEWERLVGGDEAMFARLYVVANEDDEGNPRHVGLQEVLWFCRDIQKSTGRKIQAIAIDHLDAISRHLDTSKKDTFKFEGLERESTYGSDVITISKGTICAKVKELAKKLDVFVILQSQTTKTKDGGGDIPLGKNAAFGVSNFEWYVDYIMTLWRPIKRVQDKTGLKITGWQYAKIRKQDKLDAVQEGVHYLLKFDMDRACFTELSEQEVGMVNDLIKQANVLRKKEEKNETDNYHNSPVKKLELVWNKYKNEKTSEAG